MNQRRSLVIAFLVFALLASSAVLAQETGALRGVVKDEDGGGIGDARVAVGDLSVMTDYTGAYQLAQVPVGPATVEVTAVWFEDHREPTEINSGAETVLDVTMAIKALEVLPEDLQKAKGYNQTFDWTRDKLSITHIAPPTRAAIDRGIYFRNPALYRDTSGEAPLAVGSWDFPIPTGAPKAGEQAFVEGSIKDSICQTPLTHKERTNSLLWEPAVKLYLAKWDIEKSQELYYLTFAVEGQRWGRSGTLPPQTIQHLYLHQGELWVEVVFDKWVDTSGKATDSDGDGYPEIYARVAPAHYTEEIYNLLVNEYATPTFTPLELRKNLYTIVSDLYEPTNPEILGTIGVPYEAAGVGTIQYPFVVLKHRNQSINVLLVGADAPGAGADPCAGDEGCGCAASAPAALSPALLLLFMAFTLRRRR